MPPFIFDFLLSAITPIIKKYDTHYRASISPGERLAVTLRFLATGETHKSLSYLFRVGETTIGRFVPEVCQTIYDVLKDKYIKCPNTKTEWTKVADLFQERWNLPNCLGALDGKHITIKPTACSGSQYYNYKHTFSIVLMALVDADYKFLYMDVGCNGRISDGGVFEGTTLQQALDRRSSMFPDPAPCPGDERAISYYICADDAFPLKENIMKPFSYRDMLIERRVYNYRLSRARRVVENAFGIMANRFRVLHTHIGLDPVKVEKIVMATCALHNMLRVKIGLSSNVCDQEDPITHSVQPGSWRDDPVLQKATLPTGTNITNRAKAQREYLVHYVNSEVGSVPWQLNMI